MRYCCNTPLVPSAMYNFPLPGIAISHFLKKKKKEKKQTKQKLRDTNRKTMHNVYVYLYVIYKYVHLPRYILTYANNTSMKRVQRLEKIRKIRNFWLHKLRVGT